MRQNGISWLGSHSPYWLGGSRGSGVTYLLQDEFTTARAAGSVNGTPAEPGPGGNRVVTDPGLKISISSGQLVMDVDTTNARCFRHDNLTFSRLAGRILIMSKEVSPVGEAEQGGFGWHNAATNFTTRTDGFGAFQSQTIISASRGGTGLVNLITGLSAGQVCILAFVCRTTGNYYLFKAPGEIWKLGWIDGVDTSTNLRSAAGLRNGVGASSKFNWMRIPDVLWLPTPLCYDTFTRANGTLGNSETTGPDSQSVTARAWTDQVGTWAISSNVALCSALSGGIGIATVPTGSANVIVDAALVRGTDTAGVVCRYAANNYIYAIHNGTNAQLVKVVGGSPTTLIDAAATYAANAVIRVILDGSSVSLCYNNAQVGTTQTVSDAGILNNAAHGLYSTDTDSTLNNFTVFPRGNGGEYSALDTYSA